MECEFMRVRMVRLLAIIAVFAVVIFTACYLLPSITLNSKIPQARVKNLEIIQTSPPSEYSNTTPSGRKHVRSVNPDIPLQEIINSKGIGKAEDFSLEVDLSSHTLFFKHENEVLKEYRIAAGYNTEQGDKEKEGDGRTPHGCFYICSKKVYSPPKGYIGSRWMLLSYPGLEAAEQGLQNNMIDRDTFVRIQNALEREQIPPQDTVLGSAIGIHGGARPHLTKDWTAGCIGMYDQDVEEVFEYVRVGTYVLIR
jgi:hypothetical protein